MIDIIEGERKENKMERNGSNKKNAAVPINLTSVVGHCG